MTTKPSISNLLLFLLLLLLPLLAPLALALPAPIPPWNITALDLFQTSGRPESSPFNTLNLTLVDRLSPPIHCSLQWDYRAAPPYNDTFPCAVPRWSFSLVEARNEDPPSPFENFDLEITRRGSGGVLVARENFYVGRGGTLDGNMEFHCAGSGFCVYDLKTWVLVRGER